MATDEPSPFDKLLRQYRVAAGLTQEALAERAGLSARGISNLERGVRRLPRMETVALLADALGLAPPERAAFAAAARGLLPAPQLSSLAPPSPERRLAPPLPALPTPLIGREANVAALAARLLEVDTRLLTLTGPGGVGKTRLALHLAATLAGHFPDGVVFVPLASLRDPTLVASTVAQTLGIRESAAQPLTEGVVTALRDARLLLVLDNFEQVAAAAPLVATLLASCPHLTLLVTSRQAVHVRGEQEYPVAPLILPAPDAPLHLLDALAHYPAIGLFLVRARDVKPDFALTPANAATVVSLCRRLDGLPLALELAAARLKLLPPQALLARLERRLQILTGGPHDLPERQQTMRNTIAWSYDLLEGEEQMLFRRLSVFAGGCTLDAAEAVCAVPAVEKGFVAGSGLDIFEGLAALVDKSLLRHASGPTTLSGGSDGMDEGRYTMFETIREFGLETLLASDEGTLLHRRHSLYFLALAEEAEPHLTGPEQAAWLERLEREHDNLRAAVGWLLEHEEIEPAVRLAGALWQFWYVRGYLTEGRGTLEGLLVAAQKRDAPVPLAIQAKVLIGAGMLAYSQGDYGPATTWTAQGMDVFRAMGDMRGVAAALNTLGNVAVDLGDHARATRLHEESLALRRELGDKRGVAASLNNLGLIARDRGAYRQAAALHQESLAVKRELDDRRGIAVSLNNLGLVARDEGRYDRAAALYEQSLALFRELGWKRGIAYALNNLGVVARDRGDLARAAALHEESLTLRRELGDRWAITFSLTNLGNVARDQGDVGRAAALYEESLGILSKVGDKGGIAACLEGVAALSCLQGEPARAARLAGVAAALREEMGMPIPPVDQPVHERTLASARAALGARPFTTAWTTGRALPLEQALADAHEQTGSGAYYHSA